MKSEERRVKSEEFDSPSKEENSCLGKRLYEPSAKFENSTFKTLIAPAIHSPPSLDLWSLARARRGGVSRAPRGEGEGLLIIKQMLLLLRRQAVIARPSDLVQNAVGLLLILLLAGVIIPVGVTGA